MTPTVRVRYAAAIYDLEVRGPLTTSLAIKAMEAVDRVVGPKPSEKERRKLASGLLCSCLIDGVARYGQSRPRRIKVHPCCQP